MTIYILPQKNYHIRMNGDSVCLDGKPYALKSDSGTYCFEFLSFMPFGAKYYPSFSARIVIKENSFSNISDCLSLTDWGGEIYELDVIPHAVMQNVPDVVLSAVEYVSLGRRFCASFICGCRDALAVDFLDNIQRPQIFCEYLPDKMSNVNLSVLTHENRQYLLVTGKTADRDYIMLLALNGENVDIIFEAAAEEIIFTSPNIIVKKHFKDMLRRKRSEYYTLQNGMCAEIKTEYSYEKSVSYRPELLPYLFLEAVGSGDTETMKQYVHADMRENLSDITEYFGRFYSIEYPSYRCAPLNVVALKYRKNDNTTIRFFEFFMEKGVITNFDEFNG